MNAPPQDMTAAHQLRVVVTVNDRVTGLPTDATTPLVVTTNRPDFANAVVDPTDARAIIITAENINGGCTIKVDEDPATPIPLSIPVNVTRAPDLSGVNFVSATQL